MARPPRPFMSPRRVIFCALAVALLVAVYPYDRSETVSKERPRLVAAPARISEAGTKGKFESRKDFPDDAPIMIHAAVLPDGKVIFWGRDKVFQGSTPTIFDEVGRSKVRIWNPETDELLPVDNTTTNLFCSGHSFLPDGRLFVTGGHKHAHPNSRSGDERTNIFDPVKMRWETNPAPPAMEKGRWYPFNVTLETGEVAIMAGTYQRPDQPVPNPTPPAVDTQKNPEIYNPTANAREVMKPSPAGLSQTYPYLFLDPVAGSAETARGVFIAGPKFSYFWNPRGGADSKGLWSNAITTLFTDEHREGSAVMYDSEQGGVLVVGGRNTSNVAINKARKILLNQPNPQWISVDNMTHPRTMHTATLLPNGKVLVTGGVPCFNGHYNTPCYVNSTKTTTYNVNITREAEMWDPSAPPGGQWQPMAIAEKVRGYHSVALLLPDATVLVGGYGHPDGLRVPPDNDDDWLNPRRHTTGERNVEIFKPPYLFDSNGNELPRPDINFAPTSVGYGQQFNLTYGNATGVGRVTWVRLPSVTHGFNQDQRINELTHTSSAPNQLTVTAPTDPRKCPPGHYMLFIFDSSGVPSKAKIIRISNDAPPPPPALSVSDVSQAEGNAGTQTFTFTVGLSSPAPAGGVSFNVATADGTASAASGDYRAKSLTGQTIPAGSSTYTLSVQVNGDTATEGNETFFVNVTGVTNASLADGQGQGIIVDDDTHLPAPELVWVDDALPAGAVIGAGSESWAWIDSNPSPYSGTSSHQSTIAPDTHQHFFHDATQTLAVSRNDSLFAYVYLDAANPPSQVMLQWNDGSWDHRAYWGANLIGWGIDGTNSRRRMGPLPPAGQWVRLEVPASLVGLEGRTLNGMAFTLYGGRAAWDYTGVTNTQPHIVWVDDAIPAGASTYPSQGWRWISNPEPASGWFSHQSDIVSGPHQHYFAGATSTLQVFGGETLVAYVYLDAANPPSEVMLQWNDGTWDHRAYWGANLIGFGIDGTASRRYMGPLPPAGQWVRLEVPAQSVGLEWRTLNGMAFTLYNGRAAWDYAGKIRGRPAAE